MFQFLPFLKRPFVRHRILGWIFFFQHFKYIIHCLLVTMVSEEKLTNILIEDPIQWQIAFFVIVIFFKILCLWQFDYNKSCCGSLLLILLGFFNTFHQVVDLFAIIYSNILSSLFSLLVVPWWHPTGLLGFIFPHSFSFYTSDTDNFNWTVFKPTDSFFSLLKSVVETSTEYFISFNVLFSSRFLFFL